MPAHQLNLIAFASFKYLLNSYHGPYSMQRALQILSLVIATILPSKHYFADGNTEAQERLSDLLQIAGPAHGTQGFLAFEPRLVSGPGHRPLADHNTSQAAPHRPATRAKPPLWGRNEECHRPHGSVRPPGR